MMRVLVCGSREWTDVTAVERRVAQLSESTLVIAGGAHGVDRMVVHFAVRRGLFVAEVRCADQHWRLRGRGAGHKRNRVMLDLCPDAVIAFQRAGSPGTQDTIDEARRRGLPVEVIRA
jgi:hypothetical protein